MSREPAEQILVAPFKRPKVELFQTAPQLATKIASVSPNLELGNSAGHSIESTRVPHPRYAENLLFYLSQEEKRREGSRRRRSILKIDAGRQRGIAEKSMEGEA